jgi:hypothetical protein
MRLLTMMDPEECPNTDMYGELLWYETLCRIKGIRHTTEEEVRAFLRDAQGRPDLADAFSTSYLLADHQGT